MALELGTEEERRGTYWRWVWPALLLLPVLAVALFALLFDPEIFKPQLLAAVKQATGRDLVIEGRLHLTYALRPTIAAERVRFANAAGGSRAEMISLERIEARIALLPLLQHQLEIDSLALIRPDILLETDAQGRGNWRFGEANAAANTAPANTTNLGRITPPAAPRNNFFVRRVRIDDATLTWRDGRANTVTTLGLRQAEFQMDSATAPISVAIEALWQGSLISASGQVGSLNGLQGHSGAPWPLRLILNSPLGTKLHITGAIGAPLQGKDYQLKLDASIADLAALGPLLPPAPPGFQLPKLRDVTFSAELADRGAALPEISALSLRAGPADLSALVAGLQLTRLELSAPQLDQAMRITAEGNLGDGALALVASIGAPALLLGPGRPAVPMPIDMALSAAGARISVKGSIGDPAALAGVDVSLNAQIPDPAALGKLAKIDLPALHNLTLQARLLSPPGGLRGGVVLKDLALTQPAIDLTGELAIGIAPRPRVQANLTARRIDADALGNAFAPPAPRPPAGQAPTTRAQRAARQTIPDDPLPFALLRLADGDLQLRVQELIRNGETSRNIAFRLAVQDGRLKLDPFTAEPPAGRITATLNIDATTPTPTLALRAQAQALDIRQVYHALGREGEANGTVELDLDLRGQGNTAHTIAATADGHLALAAVNGAIDNRLLNLGLLGDLLRGVNQGELLARRGTTQLRCFALRVEAKTGQGEMRALLLESSTLSLTGGGTLNLGDETLALHLRAQPRLLGIGLVLPLRVTGNFAAPRTSLDSAGSAGAAGQTVQSTAETAAGAVGSGLGAVGGALGLGTANPLAPPDACATQLAVARGGKVGALPAGEASTPRPNRPRPNPLQRLLPR